MYTYQHQVRVCYADTDQMGYVYYGNYARYYEIGRVEALRNLGFSYRELEDSGILMPVYDLQVRYLLPARYDDLLSIQVTVREIPKVKMGFHYEITDENRQVLNTGQTNLVFIRKHSMKPGPVPPRLTQLLAPYFS
jgi:acyl-CoA thioester hydrolase